MNKPTKENNKVLYCFKHYFNLNIFYIQKNNLFKGFSLINKNNINDYWIFYFFSQPSNDCCKRFLKEIKKQNKG